MSQLGETLVRIRLTCWNFYETFQILILTKLVHVIILYFNVTRISHMG